jgi:glycolate oxidase iron-sulfur subunit
MDLAHAKDLVEYAATLDCIHCGLCLRTCPTYQLTGAEASSPRGRIYLMRGVAEGNVDPREPGYTEELDFCLVCRHCESVCPAGVRFGEMMEIARSSAERTRKRTWAERVARRIGFRWILPNRFLLRACVSVLGLAQRRGWIERFGDLLGARKEALLALPPIPPASERELLHARTAARGEERGEVSVLEGCVMPELYGRVNRATVETLSAIGFASRATSAHACCGALHAHNGDLRGARELARATIDAFDALRDSNGEPLAVVVNSAGCGAHMKEYGRLLEPDRKWKERARRFAARVFDFTEFVAANAPANWRPRLDRARFGPVAYDDPCHLCHGQRIRAQPRELLDRVEGLERVELPNSESCCGSAGIYSIVRPADSAAVFAQKLAALDSTGARTLATANPGCQLQWQCGLARAKRDVRVVHVAEVLADASRELTP